MNSFRQHIPNFVDVERPAAIPFETTEDLLSLEIVQRYGKRPDFSHFAIRDNLLIEVSDDGHYWWVIGYIEHPEQIKLPKWDGGKYRAELPGGLRVELKSGDIAKSCGDVLTLQDGTTARWIR